MNTNYHVTSAFRSAARILAAGACLTLAACGSGQNWDSAPGFVTIGGTVSGLTGTLVLRNNSTNDNLAVSTDGAFTFKYSIANGTAYSVTVQSQPAGQVCQVANGSGVATAPVTNVAVTCKSDVTIGGTISGLSGTLILQNNGGNPLATTSNGPFTFSAKVANGAAYNVTVRTQPLGQTCTVTNGAGTATANVTNIAVDCEAFTLRALPAIYSTGKAINYSPYRAGGPGTETPSDADILEDLGLLHAAGYDLLRLFGGDAVSESILRLARDNYPELKFQQGIYLAGVDANCQGPNAALNDEQVATVIRLANTYPNVATVSVGNETSFFSAYMPVNCLAGYITRTRSAMTQPVTADDDYTFYAGQNSVGGDRAGVKPDTILPLLDFVSIHMYPISNYGRWDWQQTGTAAGPARAEAMMNAALAEAKRNYDAVANYEYTDNTGSTVTVGASLPIVVGETGWKAVQTNPTSAIEAVAATPVNAKWYVDLLYGNPATGLSSWERSAGGPVAIFYFEMTDESWKTTDDGWGLWDKDRVARYALCGTPVGPACNADVYEGAGYFGAPPPGGASGNTGTCTGACIDFASPSVQYEPFEGLVSAAQANDPVDATNKVAKFVKGPAGQPWAGATVYTVAADKSVPAFDLSGSKVVTLRVYAPAAGQTVRLKLENAGDVNVYLEQDALTTKANEWETLTFDFTNPINGVYNAANTYNKVSIFPLFSTTAPPASDTTYYFDELQYTAVSAGGGGASGNTGTCTGACIDFASASVQYDPFEGLVSAAQADDPVDAANKVAKFVKGPTGQPWAGATVYTVAADKSVPEFDLSGSKVVTLRVYAPAAGQTVRLKLEDAANAAVSIEKNALTTKANEWETLSFDFSAPDAGGYNPANTYNKVSIFPLFSTTAPPASDTTYYFDELQYTAVSGGGGGTLVNGVYADDYVGDLPNTAQSTLGGDVGFFFDSRLAVGTGATYDYAGVSGTAQDPLGVHNFYYGLGLNLPAITDAYFGGFVKAPGNGVVDVSGYTNILVNVWGPDQLFQAGTFPALEVILQGPAVAGCGSPSGGSEVVATFNTTAQGAAQVYTLPLASFALSFACSGETTAAEVLAHLAQVNVVLKGTNIQYVNTDPNGVAYTNGLNIGSIKFN